MALNSYHNSTHDNPQDMLCLSGSYGTRRFVRLSLMIPLNDEQHGSRLMSRLCGVATSGSLHAHDKIDLNTVIPEALQEGIWPTPDDPPQVLGTKARIEGHHFMETNPIDTYLTEVRQSVFFQNHETEGSLQYYIKWYRDRAPGHMRLFRTLGLIVLIFSATLPLVAVLGSQLPGQNLLVASMSVVIAVATGINAFFRWDTAWQGYISAQLTLEQLYNHWQITIAQAKVQTDTAKGLEIVQKATEELIEHAQRVIETETKGYFSVQRFPESQEPQSETK
jgi:hypothetical protein